MCVCVLLQALLHTHINVGTQMLYRRGWDFLSKNGQRRGRRGEDEGKVSEKILLNSERGLPYISL